MKVILDFIPRAHLDNRIFAAFLNRISGRHNSIITR